MDRAGIFQVRCGVLERYGDVLTPAVFEAMAALAPLDDTRRRLMRQRIERRRARAAGRLHLTFLAPETAIGSSGLTAADARAGRFELVGDLDARPLTLELRGQPIETVIAALLADLPYRAQWRYDAKGARHEPARREVREIRAASAGAADACVRAAASA